MAGENPILFSSGAEGKINESFGESQIYTPEITNREMPVVCLYVV